MRFLVSVGLNYQLPTNINQITGHGPFRVLTLSAQFRLNVLLFQAKGTFHHPPSPSQQSCSWRQDAKRHPNNASALNSNATRLWLIPPSMQTSNWKWAPAFCKYNVYYVHTTHKPCLEAASRCTTPQHQVNDEKISD